MTQMLTPSLLRRVLPLGAVALLFGAATLHAQTSAVAPVAPRITQRIDDSTRTVLHGNTLPIALPKYDKGAIAASTPANRMLLVLKRSDSQEAALKKLIADQHNPASPQFHKWLKPGEFGQRFGVADSDLATVTAWLQAKGFTINKVGQGKTILDISGTAGQIASTFHAELHTYVRNGKTFVANNKDPEVPTALAGVVKGFASLNSIRPKDDMKVMGTATYDPKTHKAQPQWSLPASGGGVYLTTAPGDLAVQYNIPSTATGAGETIGILSASNVDLSVVQNYRTLFNLGSATNLPNVIVDGDDPGQNGAATEAYLDVEAAGGLAPQATVNLYVGADTLTTSGLLAAMLRAVDDDVADVMSLSYGECEQDIGSSGNEFFYYVWQQAAAQGQSAFVSAGDGGSAGCDDFDSESEAVDGLAVSGFASTPYNTAVGGTDFYYSYYAEGPTGTDLNNQLAQYWNLTGTNSPAVSILSTIPEQPWNNSLGLNIEGDGYGIVAGSGGASSCAYGVDDPVSGAYDSCTGGYTKPTWQSGTGVPADGVRDIPDVSLFAANGVNFSFWPICAAGTDCNSAYSAPDGPVNITGVGGTSASSPGTAGIMALIDQSQKGRQGNANFYFYAIAAQDSTAFNDVTNGSNNVICTPGTPNCSPDTNDGYYSLQEYPATVGYDQASGLGTPNVAELIKDWSSVTFAGTTTTLSLSATSIAHGTPVTASVTVTGTQSATKKANVEAGPTGDVALITSSTAPFAKGQGTIPVTDGAGSESVILPGGTYTVTGAYSGDGVYGTSDSSPVTVTVTPENSSVTLSGAVVDSSGDEFGLNGGGSYSFGDLYEIDANIAGASGNGYASGQVTFYDGSTSIGTANANTSGVAEVNVAALTPGSHSITAKYSGDASFNAATSSAISFTVVKGTPQVYSEDSYTTEGVNPIAGQSFSVPVIVLGNDLYGGSISAQPLAPTGTAVVTFGSQSQTVTLTSASGYGANVGYGVATFSGLTAGNDALTIQYMGDSNYIAATSAPESIPVVASYGGIATTTTLTATLYGGATSVAANGAVNITATVTPAGSPLPTGYVLVYDDGVYITYFYLDGSTNAASAQVPSSYFLSGSNTITAQYLGDANYAPSNSAAVALTANSGDFSLTNSGTLLTIPSGSTGSTNLYVTSLAGMQGTVNFTCTPSNPQLLCTLAPGSIALTSDGAQYPVTVTINTHDDVTGLVKTAQSGHAPRHTGAWLAGGGIAMALMFLGFPARRRTWGTLFMLLMLAGIGAGVSGCGGGTEHAIGPSTGTNVPAGTYTVAISANDSGVVHNVTLTVVVQ
jgi:hypothetical protein